MGILDDAIREHLDLKRRRGADPAEVERAEREALGPVRRGPEPLPTEPDADYSSAQRPFGADADGEIGDHVEANHEYPRSEPDYAFEPDPDVEPVEHSSAPFDLAADPATREPEEPSWHAPEPGVERDTAEYNVEHALGPAEHAEQQPDDEDVLEETPEFLQDTPEHDRLWFEQRPPRDFDFEG
ncbi:MAG: hypothetical protein ACRDMX_17345 [Solirubrobacteraceae bacterium]